MVARRFVLFGLLLLWAAPAFADSIVIFNTGVSSSNALLPDGSIDPHYSLLSSPMGSGPVFSVISSGYPFGCCWLPNGPNSNWIAPLADASQSFTGGNYTYRTTFDLTGLNPATAVLTGGWMSDNNGLAIILNGTAFNFTTPVNSFALGFSPFTINSGFISGTNTLDFVVFQDGGSPTGLRVEVSGTAQRLNLVPEPSSFLLLATGAVAGWLRRRRN